MNIDTVDAKFGVGNIDTVDAKFLEVLTLTCLVKFVIWERETCKIKKNCSDAKVNMRIIE